jgi:hypothetical protein
LVDPVRPVAAPIAIISFDRPDYLDRLCASLKVQTGVAIDETRILLVQDGAKSPYSGIAYADDAAIARTTEVFRAHFPNGQVKASPHNLGIARNIRRAERIVFEELGAEVGYFFEDDLELGPRYLLVMEMLREALAATGKPVAYFAAYGDHRIEPDPAKVRVIPIDHHWGFGLFRKAWRAIDAWMTPYYEVLGESDYKFRNDLQIFESLRDRRVAFDKSSQDSMKALACADLGLPRVMTDACFARYIGKLGQSFDEKKFVELGYDRTQVYAAESINLIAPTAAQLQDIADRHFALYRDFKDKAYPGFIAEFRRTHLDPDRLLTAQDVHDLYRLLLGRNAEPSAIESAVGKHTFRSLRRNILNSREFRGSTGLQLGGG